MLFCRKSFAIVIQFYLTCTFIAKVGLDKSEKTYKTFPVIAKKRKKGLQDVVE